MDLDHDSYIDAGLSTDRCDLPTARRQTNRKGFPVEPTYFDDIGDGYSYIDDGHNVVTGLQAAKITPSIVRTSNVRPLSDDLLRRLARASIEEKKVHTKEGLPMTGMEASQDQHAATQSLSQDVVERPKKQTPPFAMPKKQRTQGIKVEGKNGETAFIGLPPQALTRESRHKEGSRSPSEPLPQRNEAPQIKEQEVQPKKEKEKQSQQQTRKSAKRQYQNQNQTQTQTEKQVQGELEKEMQAESSPGDEAKPIDAGEEPIQQSDPISYAALMSGALPVFQAASRAASARVASPLVAPSRISSKHDSAFAFEPVPPPQPGNPNNGATTPRVASHHSSKCSNTSQKVASKANEANAAMPAPAAPSVGPHQSGFAASPLSRAASKSKAFALPSLTALIYAANIPPPPIPQTPAEKPSSVNGTPTAPPISALDIARSITPHPLSPAPSIRPAIPPRQPPSLNTEDVLSNIYGEYAVLGGAPFRSYRSPTVESIASSRTPSHVSPYNLRNVSVTGAGSRKSAKSQIAPSETSARPSDHRQGTGFDGQYSESDKDQEQELSDHMMQLVDLAHQNGLSPDGLAALASEAGIHLDPLAYIALQQTPKPTETASISTHPSAHRSHPSAKPREQGRTLVPPSERQSIISPFSPLVNPTTRHAQAARSYDFATGDMAWLQSEYTPPPLAHPRPQRQKAFTAGIEGDSCAFEIERSSHLPSRVSSGGKLPPVSVSQWGRVGDGHCNAVWGGRAVSVSGGGSVRRSESRRD